MKTLKSANELLDSVIQHELSGDRERVLELFTDASFHSRLAALPQEGAWLKFRPGTGDGFYLVAGESGYEAYYQERGGVCFFYGRYVDMSDAAAAFFSAVAFIAPRDVSSKDLGPVPFAPLEEPTHAPLSLKSLVLGLLYFAAFLMLASIVGVYIDKTFAQ